MSISENNLQDLAIAYRQLLEFKPFQVLVEQMKEKIEDLKESNINTDDNDLKVKGMVSGIRTVINEPIDVIQQFDDSQTRETI
jgi:uncharacterized protein YjbK